MSSAPPLVEQLDAMREENRRLEREKDQLAEHNGELVSKNGELDTQLQGLTRKLELYEEELAWLKNRLYGRGTEKLSDAELQQLRLFDEIESKAPPTRRKMSRRPRIKPPAMWSGHAGARNGSRCRSRCCGWSE